MKRLIRDSKLVIVSAMLALGGLTFAAGPRLVAHAAPSGLLEVINQGGGVYVDGYAFTPGVQVRVEVLNSSLTQVLSTQYPTPNSVGDFGTLLTTPGFTGSVQVAVDQAGSPTIWAQATVLHDPYITASTFPTYNGLVGIEALGSGYYPGATVEIVAYQLRICGVFPPRTCTHVLSTQYEPASTGPNSLDPGRIFAGGLSVPAHSGTVYVTTYGGAPAASNTVSVSIP
ncbi:MAG TPA: hypothetical protein VIJ28_18280 [Chloroflexota bacterium]|jgi:hypothetical protein